jgi:hypothetical protein
MSAVVFYRAAVSWRLVPGPGGVVLRFLGHLLLHESRRPRERNAASVGLALGLVALQLMRIYTKEDLWRVRSLKHQPLL